MESAPWIGGCEEAAFQKPRQKESVENNVVCLLGQWQVSKDGMTVRAQDSRVGDEEFQLWGCDAAGLPWCRAGEV